MNPRIQNLTGKRFGKLTVICHAESRRTACGAISHLWHCICDCGGEIEVFAGNLRRGLTTSCGCFHKSVITRHGNTNHPLYKTWVQMLARCYDPGSRDYPRYGARGIAVCKSWQDSFLRFAADMGPKPSSSHTLDRIKGGYGYAPDNCRWATTTEQNTNKDCVRVVELNGQRLSFAAAMRRLGYTPSSGYRRAKAHSETAQQVVEHYAKAGTL